jgi:hypothetical protein
MIVNGEFGKILKGVVMTYFKLLLQNFLGDTKGSHNKPQDGRPLVFPEYKRKCSVC